VQASAIRAFVATHRAAVIEAMLALVRTSGCH
jgi:hypothetical protein